MSKEIDFKDVSIFQGWLEFSVDGKTYRAQREYWGYRVSELVGGTFAGVISVATSAKTPRDIYADFIRDRDAISYLDDLSERFS